MKSATNPARLAWLAVLVFMLLGLALRLVRIGTESIDLEEYACTGALGAPNLFAFLTDQRALYPYGAPFIPLLFYIWSGLAGTSILAIRIFVLPFGVALIPVIYYAGTVFFRDERGRWAGLTAALCVALSPACIFQSQEARMYAFFMLFAALSFVSLARATREDSPFWWRVNTLSNALVIWTHLFGVFLVAAQGAWLMIRYWPQLPRLIRWGCVQLLVALPVVAWGLTAPNAGATLYSYYVAPDLRAIVRNLFAVDVVRRSGHALTLSPPGRFPWPDLQPALDTLASYLDPLLMGVAILAVAVWCGCTLWTGRRMPRLGLGGSDTLLLIWFALPPAVVIFLSYTWRPVYSSRYTAYVSLAMYLMLGAAIARLPRAGLRAGALAMLAALYGYQLLVSLPGPTRTEWREVMAQVEKESPPAIPVLVEDPFWLPLIAVNRADNGRIIEGAFTRETLCDAAALCTRLYPGPDAGAWILLPDIHVQGTEGITVCLKGLGLTVRETRYYGDRRPFLLRVTGPAGVTPPPCAHLDALNELQSRLDSPFAKNLAEHTRFEPDPRAGVYVRLALALLRHGRPGEACVFFEQAGAVYPEYAGTLDSLHQLLQVEHP